MMSAVCKTANVDTDLDYVLCRERDHHEGHKAEQPARHSWAGELSSSGPSRVHVLHSIEEQQWHAGMAMYPPEGCCCRPGNV